MPGWIRLAGIALELSALAFFGYVLMGREQAGTAPLQPVPSPVPPEEPVVATPLSEPIDFITESADEGARYYRASDETAQLLAGFYSDGRVRLADAQHRFAGMVQSGHADLLELDNNQWSELFVRTTPTGRMQLELRGGPFDARVLTCESFDSLRMTKES